jgi:hypothetical protein
MSINDQSAICERYQYLSPNDPNPLKFINELHVKAFTDRRLHQFKSEETTGRALLFNCFQQLFQ